MAKTRPTLQRQSARSTGSPRKSVAIEARCSIGGREAQDVLVTELDAHGCRLRGTAVGVIKSDPLVLWLGDVGPVTGRLKWTKGGALGVSFEAPLAQELLDALSESAASSNVVPLRQ